MCAFVCVCVCVWVGGCWCVGVGANLRVCVCVSTKFRGWVVEFARPGVRRVFFFFSRINTRCKQLAGATRLTVASTATRGLEAWGSDAPQHKAHDTHVDGTRNSIQNAHSRTHSPQLTRFSSPNMSWSLWCDAGIWCATLFYVVCVYVLRVCACLWVVCTLCLARR